MSYLHIKNLYADQDILMFKECYALEKCHGTSCNISFDPINQNLSFFSGGESYDKFIKLFNQEELKQKFIKLQLPIDKKIIVYGEGAGGKQQRMSHTYGPNLFFIVFDIKIGDTWLDVPKAEKVSLDLGLEFIPYVKITTDLASIDEQRDVPSIIAIRKGVSQLLPENALVDVEPNTVVTRAFNSIVINPRIREGVVLRPLTELTKNNGTRIICKHKRDEFRETKSPKVVIDPEKIKIIQDAEKIADEYVVLERLKHVLDKIPNHSIEMMGVIIKEMVEDIEREGSFECVFNDVTKKAISKKTALLYKEYLKKRLL